MVNSNIKYRWDFLGLSTDNKPTPEESNKVVNGSTYYETDTSKLYVFYKDQWYERKPLGGGGGGGGGGSDINVVQTTGESTTDVMSQKAVTDVITPLDSGVRDALDLANTANSKATSALEGLDAKQPTLESGVNIKTVGGQTLLGSGNISVPTVETSVERGGYGASVADFSQGQVSVDFFAGDNGVANINIYTDQGVRRTTLQPFGDYEVCVENVGGNVIQIGTIKEDSNSYGLYQFYYRTSALPAANSTVIYSASNLLANYTIASFIDATGITSEGILIGNGRTDNDNRLIVQQFSKNNKSITIRAYQNFTAQTALLKVIFMGNKN